MLGARLLVSAILVPALIGLLYVDARVGPAAPVLFALCTFIGLRCTWELLPLLQRENIQPRFGPVAVCVLLLLITVWLPHWIGPMSNSAVELTVEWVSVVPPLLHVFAGCLLLLLTVRAVRFREPGQHLPSLGAEMFAVAYVGLLLSLTAELRWLWPAGNGGYILLGLVIVAAKMGDVGAYTLGRLFGRRKMSPHLSPGKTWMGAFGAVLGGMLGAGFWLGVCAHWIGAPVSGTSLIKGVLLGAVLAIAGLMGDLCESLIKRDAGVKDSAPLMPGFGGLLDLLDSILFAGPVALLAQFLLS